MDREIKGDLVTLRELEYDYFDEYIKMFSPKDGKHCMFHLLILNLIICMIVLIKFHKDLLFFTAFLSIKLTH